MTMPAGLGIRLRLVSAQARTSSGQDVFNSGTAFFGEAIAHTPAYDEHTGVFSCTAEAVWGCPAPSEDAPGGATATGVGEGS